MTEQRKMEKLIEYIRVLKSGVSVTRAAICDDIKLKRTTLKDGTECIKILIKLPKEE